MQLPLWLYMLNPWRLLAYAVALFIFDFLLLWGINALIKEVDSKLAQTAKSLSWIYIFNLVTQAVGFVAMIIATDSASQRIVDQLKTAGYYTLDAYSIPLFAYVAAAVLMYIGCRYLFLRDIDTDPLTRKVAAGVIALLTSPWIILLPVAI